jgi:hypothetical protein
MEEEVKKTNSSHYNSGEHVRFNRTAYEIFEEGRDVINASELLTEYRLAIEKQETIYKWIRRSEFTEKKAAADSNRDSVLIGMTGVVRSATKHFDPFMQDCAKHVLNVIENFGDLANANYNAETAGIDSLITKLNSKDYIAAVEALGLAPWLVELEKYNNIFKEYANEAIQELVEKPSVRYRDVRVETDRALRKIVKRITSLMDINGPDAYQELVNKYNVHVSLYNNQVNERYGRLHATTDISNAEIETIAVQFYTGKPIYVIPAVKVHKTEKDNTENVIELEFSKDFTVGYKNNLTPGTATLTITGIGKYSGEIITTFNIE